MIYEFKNYLPSLAASLLILTLLEIISTTILPIIGLVSYRLPFHILLSLYIAFKLETIYLPLIILIIHYIHSFFSIEGWEIGTITGVFICFIISYLRNIVHLSSYITTSIVIQIFHVLWMSIVGLLLYSKGVDLTFFAQKLWRFIPESISMSLIAPIAFSLLDKIWHVPNKNILRNNM